MVYGMDIGPCDRGGAGAVSFRAGRTGDSFLACCASGEFCAGTENAGAPGQACKTAGGTSGMSGRDSDRERSSGVAAQKSAAAIASGRNGFGAGTAGGEQAFYLEY